MPSSIGPKRVETELGKIADALDELERERRKLELRRKQWLMRGKELPPSRAHPRGVGYRTLARWARITNPRVHQIIGPEGS